MVPFGEELLSPGPEPYQRELEFWECERLQWAARNEQIRFGPAIETRGLKLLPCRAVHQPAGDRTFCACEGARLPAERMQNVCIEN